jgi:hypothetical protein
MRRRAIYQFISQNRHLPVVPKSLKSVTGEELLGGVLCNTQNFLMKRRSSSTKPFAE